jgi:uncharacterized protein YlxP (DUF503 family)
MTIGLLRLELRLPTANSLKDKRSVLRRLFAHLRRTYNVGVAELDHHDTWRSAQIGVVTIFNERAPAEQTLSKVVGECLRTDGMEVVGQETEFL